MMGIIVDHYDAVPSGNLADLAKRRFDPAKPLKPDADLSSGHIQAARPAIAAAF